MFPTLNYQDRIEPKRLPSRTSPSAANQAWSFVFGVFLLLGGLMMVLALTKPIRERDSFVYGLAALFTYVGGFGLIASLIHRHRATTSSHADYPWEVGCSKDSVGASIAYQLGCAFGLVLFFATVTLGILHGDLRPLQQLYSWSLPLAARFSNPGVFTALWTIPMAGFVGVVVAKPIALAVRRLRYGTSEVQYEPFPLSRGTAISLRWVAPASVREVTGGRFVLHCISEEIEETRRGDTTSVSMVHTSLWSRTLSFDQEATLPGPSLPWPLAFDVPADLPATSLKEAPVVFWELHVHLETSGPDFKATYLLPIY